ncbi:MAG: hypothetical protein ACM3ST_16720 [Bdellovibrio bacteriovorus]
MSGNLNGDPTRRGAALSDQMELAEIIRAACLQAILEAYEDAGISGLCGAGRWEIAVQALRGLDLRPLVDGLPRHSRDDT